MAVAVVLVAVTLIVISVISLLARVAIVIIAAIGRDDATGGYEKKSGKGATSGNALQGAHTSLQ